MWISSDLKAFSVNNSRSTLIILVTRNPHTLKRCQRRQDRSTNPHRVFSLGLRIYSHPNRLRHHIGELLGEALLNTRVHGRSARQHDILVEFSANVNVAFVHALVELLVYAVRLASGEARLEEDLRRSEALVSNQDHLAVRQLVALFYTRRFCRLFHLFLEVKRNVAKFLFNVSDDLLH